MSVKKLPEVTLKLDKIVGGGQALGTLDGDRKAFVWGGLPGEVVKIQLTRKKSRYVEGVVTEVIRASKHRIQPQDSTSYLSTSPWQIMDFEWEQRYKAALVEEAFELHDIVLPGFIEVFSDKKIYEYRNKIEYSFWYDHETELLSLAFFRRGTHGKIPIDSTSLASKAISKLATQIVEVLNDLKVDGRNLKTLLIRSSRDGQTAWQLYVKTPDFDPWPLLKRISDKSIVRGEIIHSDPRSPSSLITKVLASSSNQQLSDKILNINFNYPTESFFQINLPVYEQALRDMKQFIPSRQNVVDMYSGVGTIGLTVGGEDIVMVEINESAVSEMEHNIKALGRDKQARAVLAPSESALGYIKSDAIVIVDPPRAGLHENVVRRLLEVKPKRIVYLSCNPVTQARDIARLAANYGILYHKAYNFFPRTPHIEHLIVLDESQILASS